MTDQTPDRPAFRRYLDASDAVATEQPRRVPTMAERVGCGHTPEQHRHADGQAADDRSKDRAIRELTAERDAARIDRDVLGRDRGDALAALTKVWTALNQAGIVDPVADAGTLIGRLAAERDRLRDLADSNQQVATFRQGVIDLHATELGQAGEVIAVFRDVIEQAERALARYDTAPEVTPVEAEHAHSLGTSCPLTGCRWPLPDAPLGSVSPRAQDRPGPWMNRRALVSDTLRACLAKREYQVPVPVADRVAEAVLIALDEQDQPAAQDAHAQGYAAAIAYLLDDDRYKAWWATTDALPNKPPRQHLAEYLEEVGPAAVNELRQG